MSSDSLDTLRTLLAAFADERDWRQFHNPKNLAMALSVEAAELLEQFQWLTPEQAVELDAARLARVEDELADVLNYVVRLADELDVDLTQAALRKIEKNHEKYPAERVRGSAAKYTEYERGEN